MLHPDLDKKLRNPTWYSLKETHKDHALSINDTLFYDPSICPFGAYQNEEHTVKAINNYARMSSRFFIVDESRIPQYDNRCVRLLKKYDGCQMVLTDLNPTVVKNEIILLDEKHIKDVYDLVWLVMPGFYRLNSFLMGDFYGIFEDDKLVAVSGQRMQGHEFTEISAVVTHPAYTRRGYAGQLVSHVTKEILKTNKLPILHTTKGNPAINLYNKLGFETTRDMNWWHFATHEA